MKRLVRTHSNCAYIAITSLKYTQLFYTPYVRIKLMSASLFIQYQFH